MKRNKIRIVSKRIGEAMEVMEMEHTLENMQEKVGGHLEVVELPNGIDLWLNEEGLLEQLSVNVLTVADGQVLHTIVGNVFFAGHNDEGETIGLTDQQIAWLKVKMQPVGEVGYTDGREPTKFYAIDCD